jgi:hypothetical protein
VQEFLRHKYEILERRAGRIRDYRCEAAMEGGIDRVIEDLLSGKITADTEPQHLERIYSWRRNDVFRNFAREAKNRGDVVKRAAKKTGAGLEELFHRMVHAWILAHDAELLFDNKARREPVEKIAIRKQSTRNRIRYQIERQISQLKKSPNEIARFAERFLLAEGIPLAVTEALLKRLEEIVKSD